ncbi:MAG: GTP 3',8-cyclase MoaA [Pseudothermotoga sp.]
MQDRYARVINYLRFSITDRCNHRCFYCMPPDVEFLAKEKLMSLEEILTLGNIFHSLGIEQVRITGGEPLMRDDVVQIVKAFSEYFRVSMTTNGSRLKDFAEDLKGAGLQSVNVSLNSLDEYKFRQITRGEIKPVLDGIDEAIKYQLFVKLNVVVSKMNIDEVPELAKYASFKGVPIRFIEMMPVGRKNSGAVFEKEILDRLSSFELKPVSVQLGVGPARYFVTSGGNYVGIISAMSKSFCSFCNKIRLSCDGKLYPCLGSTIHVDLLQAIRSKYSHQQIIQLIQKVLESKPYQHDMNNAEIDSKMNRLGG